MTTQPSLFDQDQDQDQPLWTGKGHPGQCPKCRSPHVRWRWKPDLYPTHEDVRCFHCGWTEARDYASGP